MRFLGIDLGWLGRPSGVASLEWEASLLRLRAMDRLESHALALEWVDREVGSGNAIIAVDAPLVIPNRTGIRQAERALNAEFSRYHAGCHPANLGRPFARATVAFSRALEARGFKHGAEMPAREPGRIQIEVHPHAAAVGLFRLPRILKYKRGRRAARAAELARLRQLLGRLVRGRMPHVPKTGDLKAVEDRLDAVLCAYIGAHWWLWGPEHSTVFGTHESGYIVVPRPLDPIRQFGVWFETAQKAGIQEPTAMTLATATAQGGPSARMVLLKGCDERGFVFYTNYESRKGRELDENPRAALVFWWPLLQRQVRIAGRVTRISAGESDAYFASRPPGHRWSASVSRQSAVIASREELERAVAEFAASHPDAPRPPFWGGYRLRPEEIEFWQGRPNRLHDRFRYRRRRDGSWRVERLSP